MTELEQYIVALPKAELHLHLEGAIDIDTLDRLAPSHGLAPPPRDLYEYQDFLGFLKAFKIVCDYLQKPEDYALVTHCLVERLAAAGVRYAEVLISAGVLLWQQKPLERLFDGIEAGYCKARERCGIEVRWIFDATRQFGPEAAMEVARAAVRLRDRGVVALGIGGDENRGAPEMFREAYDFARGAGLHLHAHAGEAAGPASIWGALRALQVERIGHGIRAVQDPELVAYLAEHRIPLDVCLTSNVRTGILPRLEDHPVRQLFDAGVPVNLSTDDPAMFQTDLLKEYRLAHEVLGFTREELAVLARNSLSGAFDLPRRRLERH